MSCTSEMHVYEVHTHEMYACEVHTHELHADEVHAHEVHAREMHTDEVHACEMHACEMHACEVHVYEVHTHEMHVFEVHAYEEHACEIHAYERVYELWYRSGCRAAALASSSTLAVGQSFRQASHHAERALRVTGSLTAESRTIRSFSIFGVDIGILATRVLRTRKRRK